MDVIQKSNNKNIHLALDIFIYRIIKYIGAYIVVLGGLDNLVFTAGIGENIPIIRKKVCDSLSFIGVKVDKKLNIQNKEIISSKSSKVKVYVKKTNEEYVIAKKVLDVSK